MTRDTRRRTRQALITTGATLGLIVTGITAFTGPLTLLITALALLVGCGIAQAIEEHLGRPRDEQPRAYRHHDRNHDHQ